MVLCRNAAQTVRWVFIGGTRSTSYLLQIWLHVPNDRPHKTDPALSKPALYGIIEKKSMINLVSRIVRSAVAGELTPI